MTECFLIERKTNKLTTALAKTLYGNIDIVRSVVELPMLFQFRIYRERERNCIAKLRLTTIFSDLMLKKDVQKTVNQWTRQGS